MEEETKNLILNLTTCALTVAVSALLITSSWAGGYTNDTARYMKDIEKNITLATQSENFRLKSVEGIYENNETFVEFFGSITKQADSAPELCGVVYNVSKEVYDDLVKYSSMNPSDFSGNFNNSNKKFESELFNKLVEVSQKTYSQINNYVKEEALSSSFNAEEVNVLKMSKVFNDGEKSFFYVDAMVYDNELDKVMLQKMRIDTPYSKNATDAYLNYTEGNFNAKILADHTQEVTIPTDSSEIYYSIKSGEIAHTLSFANQDDGMSL